MIKYCRECQKCKARTHENGIEVMCTNDLAPNSWRNKWILRRPGMLQLMCPVPEQWFEPKELNTV